MSAVRESASKGESTLEKKEIIIILKTNLDIAKLSFSVTMTANTFIASEGEQVLDYIIF